MARKKKTLEKKYVIAIKDYDNTKEGIESGNIKMEYENELYLQFFNPEYSSVNDMSHMRKFLKKVGLKKAEVQHYWRGLIEQGFTLTQIIFVGEENEFRKLCDEQYIKYLHGLN